MKQRLNVTISSSVLARARILARKNKQSLSSMIEQALERVAMAAGSVSHSSQEIKRGGKEELGTDPLSEYYRRYVPRSLKQLSDKEISKIRDGIGKKYS